jgi:NADH dehydrogenase
VSEDLVLVAGGTGRLGTLVVRRLVDEARPVRVLTRDPERADHLPGVEVAVADVRHRGDLADALDGVTTVVSAVHGFAGPGRVSPASVDRDGNANLIAAAGVTGAHVVLMSVLGAAPDHPMELFRMKAAAESRLRSSGLPWTIVRAGAFLELYRVLLQRTAGRSGRPLVFGRGDNPVTFAAVGDVAEAVHRAVVDPRLRGTVVDVVGPTCTFNELAAAVVDGSPDRPPRPRHVPRPVLRVLAAAGSTTPARQARAALVMDSYPFTYSSGSGVVPAGGSTPD